MSLFSLLLSAILCLVSCFVRCFGTKSARLVGVLGIRCLIAYLLLAIGQIAYAQGVPTLAPPDPNESPASRVEDSSNKKQRTAAASDTISAPPLLVPKKADRKNRLRPSTQETLPSPKDAGFGSKNSKGEGSLLDAPSNEVFSQDRARAWSLPHEQHPWGRFSAGAWRTFRIESESFDETGISLGHSTTIRTESLLNVGVNHYQLQISTLVDIGGKQLPGTPQVIAFDLLTDGLVEPSSIDKQGTTTITLHGQAVPCAMWDIVIPLDRGERHELIYYSEEQSPHVLRRERTDTIEGRIAGKKTTNITTDGLPILIGDQLQPSRHLLVTEQFTSGGQREAFEVHSDQIPGGLVESTEVDYGPTGQRVRWATTELIGAGLQQGIPLIEPSQDQAKGLQVPRLMMPQLQSPRPIGSPFSWRRRIDDEDRDNDDQDDDHDEDDDDQDDQDDKRERDRDDRDEDDREDEDFRPRRLLRLLRRAEISVPLPTDSVAGEPTGGENAMQSGSL